MKTEREIRRHRDNLRLAQKAPCECRGTGHEEACHRGMMMLESTQMTLSWILGEAPEMQRLVEKMERELHANPHAN